MTVFMAAKVLGSGRGFFNDSLRQTMNSAIDMTFSSVKLLQSGDIRIELKNNKG